MKRLVLMRHAEAGWDDYDLPDHERPLTKDGLRDALKMGALLKEKGLEIDRVFCSTAKRAQDTLSLFLWEYAFKGEPRYFDLLYHAEVRDYVDMLMQLSPDVDTAMIVAHNPTMSVALEFFADKYQPFSPATIAYLEFDIEQWSELIEKHEGELLGFWVPKRT